MYRAVEVFGMFRQRFGELLACLDVLLDPQQHKLEPGVFQKKNERSFLCCGHELKALSLGLHLRKPGLSELYP